MTSTTVYTQNSTTCRQIIHLRINCGSSLVDYYCLVENTMKKFRSLWQHNNSTTAAIYKDTISIHYLNDNQRKNTNNKQLHTHFRTFPTNDNKHYPMLMTFELLTSGDQEHNIGLCCNIIFRGSK